MDYPDSWKRNQCCSCPLFTAVLRMQLHLLANFCFWNILIRFGQIWSDLGKIWAKLKRNLGKS